MVAKGRPGFVVTPGETHDVKGLRLTRPQDRGRGLRRMLVDRVIEAFWDNLIASQSHPETFGRRVSPNHSPVAAAGV